MFKGSPSKPTAMNPPFPDQSLKNILRLEVSYWKSEEHNLYSNQNGERILKKETFHINATCTLFLHPTELSIRIEPPESRLFESQPDYVYIGRVVVSQNGSMSIQSADVTGVQPIPFVRTHHPDYFRNSYFSVRELCHPYPLEVGNYLKLGKEEFKVTEIQSEKGLLVCPPLTPKNSGEDLEVESTEKGICKFCLNEEGTAENPLIGPCLCRGTCRLVHVECLRKWIANKLNKESRNVSNVYTYSQFDC